MKPIERSEQEFIRSFVEENVGGTIKAHGSSDAEGRYHWISVFAGGQLVAQISNESRYRHAGNRWTIKGPRFPLRSGRSYGSQGSLWRSSLHQALKDSIEYMQPKSSDVLENERRLAETRAAIGRLSPDIHYEISEAWNRHPMHHSNAAGRALMGALMAADEIDFEALVFIDETKEAYRFEAFALAAESGMHEMWSDYDARMRLQDIERIHRERANQ